MTGHDISSTFAGWVFSTVSWASAGLAGAAVSIGDTDAALPLGVVAGVCGIVGALFFRAQEDDTVTLDLSLIAAAFIFGMSLGPGIGKRLFDLIPGLDQAYVADFAPHMLGGLISGGCLVLVFRIIWARVRDRGGLMKEGKDDDR